MYLVNVGMLLANVAQYANTMTPQEARVYTCAQCTLWYLVNVGMLLANESGAS
jgi:hypothetical protein